MKRAFQSLFVLLLFVAVFGAFQYWAIKARERQWWWFGGGPNHMTFADLHHAEKHTGHVLLIERAPENAAATEYEVNWTCAPDRISWGQAWTRDEAFNQIDREPAPAEKKRLHPSTDAIEQGFLSLACSTGQRPANVFKLKPNSSPIELARDSFKMIATGVPPYLALERAAAK